MDANTIELLKECNKGCKMAVESMKQVKCKIKNPEFKELINKYIKKHRDLEDKSSELLDEYGKCENEPGMMTEAFSWMTTEMKLMMDDGDGRIAKLMMDGCSMSIQSVSEYINKYGDASEESKKLAYKLVDLAEEFMKDLKEYV
ncbi:MAG: hypothetical protein E7266_07790 [Lachnospiraceae bacterium]|nr:hypothetical protein [Lachnospiraceae bacterium]